MPAEPEQAHEHLTALLSDCDAPCPHCGYNLRGTKADVCPECGHAIDAKQLLRGGDRVSIAWILMLVSYAAALPWSLFYVWQRLIIRRVFYYGPTGGLSYVSEQASWSNPRFLLSYGWWLSVPFVVAALIVFQRRIERLPAWLRCGLAISCIVLVVLAFRRWQFWYTYAGWDPNYIFDFWWLPDP